MAVDATTPAEGNKTSAPPGVSRWVQQRYAEPVLLAVLFLACFLVRLWPVWQVHFWDETVYLQNAEVICCAKNNYSELDSRPPLLSLLFALAFRLWHSAYAASALTAFLNALGPLFLYLAGRQVAGRATAAIAAGLLAFLPFFVSGGTGNSLLTDSPALTLVLVLFWLLLKATENNSGVTFAMAGLVSAMAVLMRFASLPTVTVLSLLVLRADRWMGAGLRYAAGVALGFAPYLMWSRIQYGGFFTTLRHGWRNVTDIVELSPTATTYYLQNFVQIFSWTTVAGLVLWLGTWVWANYARWEHEGAELVIRVGRRTGTSSRRLEIFLCCWAAAAFFYFSMLRHKELRYILPVAPPLFLLASRGLAVLLSGRGLRLRVAGTLALAAMLGCSFAPVLARFHGPFVSPFISEEKQVSDFLNAKARPGAFLYANFNYPVFGYYTHLPTRVLLELDGSFYSVFPKNMPKDGYLILYKELDWDPHLEWADSNTHFRRMQEFPSLVVYEYHASAR